MVEILMFFWKPSESLIDKICDQMALVEIIKYENIHSK